MRTFIFAIALILTMSSAAAFADRFVPDFSGMPLLRCDYEEIVFDKDGQSVSKSRKFRLYRIDDENSKIYINKEPVDNVLNYDAEVIEFKLQTLTDDSIIMNEVKIDRKENTYNASARIMYDNPVYGERTSKSSGVCKVPNN